MKTVEDVAELVALRRAPVAGGTGFVPTMGALHAGHLSLVARSKAENAQTVASIFVNPAQFDDPGDLARYPRTLEEDLAVLERAGCDLVFLPRAREMYPDGYRYRVTESEFSQELEGASRPGHFDGVLTVVLKLLLLVRPERAYFGEKDYQQLRLVEGLVQAFFLDTTIVRCPTTREADGLAMSSRNRRLTTVERAKAPAFHRVLEESLAAGWSAGEAEAALGREGFDVDYVADRDGRRLGAVRLGGVRLIDNVG
ncbi:MAG TPA: pantoate--beta-alanine ligase [Steroidobacteraceae bacterium]|nr:pantoate--beta-alanine ligase [Steroidobacteraceae bacterium]